MMLKLLVVEDDDRFAATLQLEADDAGYSTIWVKSLGQLYELEPNQFQRAIVDLRLGQENGLNAIETILQHSPECRIVMLSGYASVAWAVLAIKRGAVNFLSKPASFVQIMQAFDDRESDLLQDDAIRFPTLARMEREYIEMVLARFEGNVTHTAEALGLHRQSLQRKLRKFVPREKRASSQDWEIE